MTLTIYICRPGPSVVFHWSLVLLLSALYFCRLITLLLLVGIYTAKRLNKIAAIYYIFCLPKVNKDDWYIHFQHACWSVPNCWYYLVSFRYLITDSVHSLQYKAVYITDTSSGYCLYMQYSLKYSRCLFPWICMSCSG